MVNGLVGRASGGARKASFDWTTRLCGALVLVLLPWAAQGDHLSEYNYTVLRDGETIGTHRVTVSPEGRYLKVVAETDLEVEFGPLSVRPLITRV